MSDWSKAPKWSVAGIGLRWAMEKRGLAFTKRPIREAEKLEHDEACFEALAAWEEQWLRMEGSNWELAAEVLSESDVLASQHSRGAPVPDNATATDKVKLLRDLQIHDRESCLSARAGPPPPAPCTTTVCWSRRHRC